MTFFKNRAQDGRDIERAAQRAGDFPGAVAQDRALCAFEEELKQALRRQEPAADFTARVLALCAQEDARSRSGWWRPFWIVPAWRFGVIAAALLIAAGGTAYQQHEREARGLAAKRQLILAVRIAGAKLQEVQQRVAESTEIEQ